MVVVLVVNLRGGKGGWVPGLPRIRWRTMAGVVAAMPPGAGAASVQSGAGTGGRGVPAMRALKKTAPAGGGAGRRARAAAVAADDPLAILTPARKKLGTVAAERIVAVLDTSLAKLAAVSRLAALDREALAGYAAALEGVGRADIAEAVLHHRSLQRRLAVAAGDRNGEWGGNSEGEGEGSGLTDEERDALCEDTEDVTRTLLRLLLADPAALALLQTQGGGRHADSMAPLLEPMETLRGVLFEKLVRPAPVHTRTHYHNPPIHP